MAFLFKSINQLYIIDCLINSFIMFVRLQSFLKSF